MIRYAARALAAQVRRGRLLFALTVFGVALGIASVLSIQVINRSAMAAFRGGLQAISGDADLSVLPRTPAMAESLYAVVLGTAGVRAAWPLYQVSVALAGDEPPTFLDIVGTDLYAGTAVPLTGDAADMGDALARPGWVAVTPELAAERRWRIGSTVPVSSGSRVVTLTVGALVDFRRYTPLASRRLAVMDIAQAQALLGERGALTQVDVRAEAGRAADVARALAARLGPGVEVLRPEQRERRAEGLMRAFRLNLTALSLIALVVGFFLVHTATQAALVRRRVEFGVLRANGATRLQVFGLIVGEAAVLGLLGVAVGIPVGLAAARANLDVVSATLTNLYLLGAIERLDVPAWLYALAVGLGLLGAAFGALGPALDVARAEVKDLLAPITLHERTAAAAGRLAAAGLTLLAVTGLWFGAGGHRWQPAGFVWAVVILLALPLVTPWLLARVGASLRLTTFGLAFSLKSLATRLTTTAFAVASLAIAVSMLVGITVMVASFRATVTQWIGGTLQADVYVTTLSWRGTGAQGTLDGALVEGLAGLDGVRAVDRLRGFPALSGDRRIALAGVDMAITGGEARFPLQAGDLLPALAAVRDSGCVLVSEPLSRKTGLGVGDTLVLATPTGDRGFRIAGVTYDYSSENGAAVMDLRTMAEAFGDGPLNSVALYLDRGRDADAAVDAVRARFPAAPLNVRSNRSLRAEVLRIFDQTFAITQVLQVMALLVAATGITLTLLVLARERLGELALYRALGARRRQLFAFFVGKGLGIGIAGLTLGLAGGAALAAVLILVINRAYFGWTIQVARPWGQVAGAAATIVGAAVLASLYPALTASRTPAGELSRDDT